MGYIQDRYKPGSKDLVCEFHVEPEEGYSFEEVIEQVTSESGIGTWTDVATMTPRVREKLKPTAFDLERDTGCVKIAYPQELFEPDNMPQILSSIAGNIFGMKMVKNLRLEDVEFPEKMINAFKGPKFGIEGVRKILDVYDRPLLGTIVKPKVGLTPTEHANVCYEAWVGGCDIVKDDENLTNQTFNKFEDRLNKTYAALKKAEKLTGQTKVYMPNVSAETMEMIARAKAVKKKGGTHAMIDVFTCGFSALQTLREVDLGLAIHAHRAMHAAMTRNPVHGISMLALAKCSRLIGVDQLHIGTVVGKMEGVAADVLNIEQEVEKRFILEDKKHHILQEHWGKIKPIFAVLSGGLHPGLVGRVYDLLGKDIIIQAGGGVHGHPHGTKAGAAAMIQAVEAAVQGISAEVYAETHPELSKAIHKWGY